jgi:LTXXQ motif family protein
MNFSGNPGRGIVACVFALASLAIAVDAVAQFGGGFPGGGIPGGGGMRGSRGGGDRGAAREQQRPAAATAEPRIDMLEQTIEELRVDLKLLSAQMPAWEAYTGKVRALAGDISRSRFQMPAGPETNALQRLDRSVAARNRLAAMEEVSDAAKVLYAVLAPEQKSRADPRLATIVLSLTSTERQIK